MGCASSTFAYDLRVAASYGDLDSPDGVKALLRDYRGEVDFTNEQGHTALFYAVAGGRSNVVPALLAAGANPNVRNCQGDPLLFIAASLGSPEIAQALLAAGAETELTDEDGNTALQMAAIDGHTEIVRLLLSAGAKVDARVKNDLHKHDMKINVGKTPLILATSKGHTEAVRALLAHGADVNAKGTNGDPSLILAAADGRVDIARALISVGALVDIRDNDGRTPLLLASSRGHADIALALINAGANVNVRNLLGNTPLFLAADRGHRAIVKNLLSSGVDVNLKGQDGDTALMRAIYQGHRQVAEDILSLGKGINLEDTNDKGATALSAANIKCMYGVVRKIREIKNGKQVSGGGPSDVPKRTSGSSSRVPEKRISRAINIDAPKATTAMPGNAAPSKTQLPSITVGSEYPEITTPKTESEIEPLAPSWPPLESVDSHPEKYLNLWKVSGSSTACSSPTADTPLRAHELPPRSFMGASSGRSTNSSYAFHHRRSSSASSEAWTVPFGDLKLGSEIGQGTYGKVFKAGWQEIDVAVKIFNLPTTFGDNDSNVSASSLLAKIRAEADLLASIRHPHILSFLGVCSEPPCVITEWCSRGSLFDVLRLAKVDPGTAAQLTWACRLEMASDAAAGMLHLHQRSPPIVHRDMKSLNLLVNSNWEVKVADLGLSRLAEEATMSSKLESIGKMNPRWVAPEIVQGQSPIPASDVYSFGLVLLELITWELPWEQYANPLLILAAIMRGENITIPECKDLPGPGPASEEIYDQYTALILRCIDPLPNNRPGFGEITQSLKALAAEESRIQELNACREALMRL